MSSVEDLSLKWDAKKKIYTGTFVRPDKGLIRLALQKSQTFGDLNKLLGVAPSDYKNEDDECMVSDTRLLEGLYRTPIFDREFVVLIVHHSRDDINTKEEKSEESELSRFWGFLPSAVEDENKFVKLTNGTSLIGEKSLGTGFYVRKAYTDLWNMIEENRKGNKPISMYNRIAILGTPGVGKTFFLYYLLWKLSQIKATVIFWRKQPQVYCLFEGTKVSYHTSVTEILKYTVDEKCWCLVDSAEALICNATTILSISPSAKMADNRQYLREKCSHRYMPTWTLDEVLQVGTHSLGFESSKLTELYRRWGGVGREVFDEIRNREPLQEEEVLLNRIIGSLDDPEQVLNSVDAPDKMSHISDKLVHYQVSNNYSNYGTRFASEYVAKSIYERIVSVNADRIRIFLRDSAGIADISAIRGNIFEKYVHSKLTSGGSFRYRSLRTGDEGVLEITEKKEQRFDKASELASASNKVYLRPKANNFPAVDSLIKPNFFFQITIAKEHPIIRQRLADLIGSLGITGGVNLIFVVSEEIYPTFGVQKYKEVRGNDDLVNQTWNQVEQYALEIKFSPLENPEPTARI